MVIKSKMNFPIFLTYIRIIFAPIIVIMLLMSSEDHYRFFTMITFIAISLTDFFDGYIARKRNLESDLGGLLDLLADKLFVSILLIWFCFNLDSLLILISTILIVSRDIIISYVRLFLISTSNKITDIKSDIYGKLKTTFQMISLGFLLISSLLPPLLYDASLILIFFSALLSWYSLLKYLNKWIV